MFIKHQHVEKLGTDEARGIEFGSCYVFPKIDGTNASIWLGPVTAEVKCGSGHREITLEDDNAFRNYVKNQTVKYAQFLAKYPHLRLYGKWSASHPLKTYKGDARNKFYVFDVCVEQDGELIYLSYEYYKPKLEEFNIEYIPPIGKRQV